MHERALRWSSLCFAPGEATALGGEPGSKCGTPIDSSHICRDHGQQSSSAPFASFTSLATLHLAHSKEDSSIASLHGPCIPQAIESFALCVGQWGWVRRDALPQRTDVLLFSAATAAICHCYSDGGGRHRDVFRSKYLNVLDFILGNTGASARAAAVWPRALLHCGLQGESSQM